MAEIKLKTPRFYTSAGEPAYDATLREARKQNLYPSVTTVMQVMAKPQLERWKQLQFVLAAVTRTAKAISMDSLIKVMLEARNEWPHPDDPQWSAKAGKIVLARLQVHTWEDPEGVAQEIINEAEREAALAAQWGTDFHELISRHAQGYPVVPTQPFEPHWLRFKAWWDQTVEDVIELEKGVAHHSGFAGRLDCLVKLKGEDSVTLLDFKGRKGVKGKPVFYDEQVMQLTAYGMAWSNTDPQLRIPECMSVVIDRDVPSHPWTKLWDQEETENGLGMFRDCLSLWKRVHKYWPT